MDKYACTSSGHGYMHYPTQPVLPTCLQMGELQICWPDDLPGSAIMHDQPGLVRAAILTLDHTDGACHKVDVESQ